MECVSRYLPLTTHSTTLYELAVGVIDISTTAESCSCLCRYSTIDNVSLCNHSFYFLFTILMQNYYNHTYNFILINWIYFLWVYELYEEPSISIIVKLKRVQWAGHVHWMGNERIPKKILYATIEAIYLRVNQGIDGLMLWRKMQRKF